MNSTYEESPWVRWMIRRDIPRVVEIEQALADPMDEKQIIKWITQRTVIGRVVEVDGVVVGHMIYELMDGLLWVHRVAVDVERRRQGFGSALVRKIMGKLRRDGHAAIEVVVGEDDFELIGFFRSLGFGIVGTLGKTGRKSYQLRFSVEARLHVDLKNRIKG
jgi:ribosomal protein S18 acetylase RimI-like enzyme